MKAQHPTAPDLIRGLMRLGLVSGRTRSRIKSGIHGDQS